MFAPVTLRTCNNYLTVIVMLLGVYIVGYPFLPYLLQHVHSQALPAANIVQVESHNAPPPVPISDEPTLTIPRLHLQETIHTGPSIYELNKGVWLVPHTSTPDADSNTVIIGHRFTYAGPAVFYFLDQVQINDRITVDWGHKEYTYKVRAVTVVPPTDIAVQNASSTPILTLYTCTPLITAKNRLVITAPLVGVRT